MNMYGGLEQAIAGQKFGLDAETESFAAGEKLYPGDPVFGMTGDDKVCYGAHINAVSVGADADLVSGNSVAVVINGIALSPVLFEGSSEETLKKIVSGIDQSEAVRELGIDAFYTESSPRSFVLQGPGITITALAAAAGGASQPQFTASAYTSMKFMGAVRHEELSCREGTGFFPAGASVPVQTWGKITVPVADSAKPEDKKPAYIILTGDDAGKFTDSNSGAYDCGCFFRSSRIAGSLALIELRGMK